MKQPKKILISRSDAIGDVMLTLPMAGILKQHFPGVHIAFLGRAYTKPVIQACVHVDSYIDTEDFLHKEVFARGELPDVIIHVFPVPTIAKRAKALGIKWRVGTTNRLWHWQTCNKLVKLSRKNSPLHEAQLNVKLLKAIGISESFTLDKLTDAVGFSNISILPDHFKSLLQPGKFHLIIHPKSQGSAREWGLDNFINLVKLLDTNKIQILLSGTKKEQEALRQLMDAVQDRITDITGLMNLTEFVSFIAACDGLVANSTGPAHIAAALGKHVFALYPPIRPMHPGRWAPLGKNVQIFVHSKHCSDCRKAPESCQCMLAIMPFSLVDAINSATKG